MHAGAALRWRQCWRYGREMRCAGRLRSGVLATPVAGFLAAVTALVVAPVAVGAASLALPAFVAGPLLSGGTLVWQDTAGLQALSPGGTPRPLLSGGTLPEVSAGGGWIALDTGSALLAGKADGTPAPVSLPHGCLPLAAAKPPSGAEGFPAARALFAVSGPRLFAVVGPDCRVGRRDRGAATRIVMFGLNGHRTGLVRRLSRRPLSVALDGATGALLDSTDTGTPTVTVFRPHVKALTEPASGTQGRQITPEIQIDKAGNVLTTALARTPPPGWVAASGVAIPAGGKAFEPGIRAIEPFSGQSVPARPAAALSDGRLAFLTGTSAPIENAGKSVPAAPLTKIEVLDLSTGTAVTIDIAPDNDVLGIALEGGDLAWIQQPVAVNLGAPTTDPALPTCEYGNSPTGPPVLENANLAELSSTPITVGNSPAPVACTWGPVPP
jgi:hypothetical protein